VRVEGKLIEGLLKFFPKVNFVMDGGRRVRGPVNLGVKVSDKHEAGSSYSAEHAITFWGE